MFASGARRGRGLAESCPLGPSLRLRRHGGPCLRSNYVAERRGLHCLLCLGCGLLLSQPSRPPIAPLADRVAASPTLGSSGPRGAYDTAAIVRLAAAVAHPPCGGNLTCEVVAALATRTGSAAHRADLLRHHPWRGEPWRQEIRGRNGRHVVPLLRRKRRRILRCNHFWHRYPRHRVGCRNAFWGRLKRSWNRNMARCRQNHGFSRRRTALWRRWSRHRIRSGDVLRH
mmetsp:Transcript_76204/g.211816  ORF Transcript_76204/g.211816 Transcript_76204/m.211816 type:complete len:228 (-) Transcript_76204:128-811(-)